MAPIRWRDKIILAKMEAVYGTDPVPTGEANAILMTDVAFQPMEGEDISRNLLTPHMGNQGSLSAGLRAVIAGTTELAGSGSTGVAPAWGVLARCCALAQVVTPDDDPGDGTVVYSPVSEAHESATIYFYMGATRQVLSGVRGTGVVNVTAQGIPSIRWTLTGLWNAPNEQGKPTPSFAAWKKPLVASKVNTPLFEIDDAARILRSFELNLGNDVQPRLLIGDEGIKVVDKGELLSMTIESVPLSTFDPFAKALTKTPVKVELQHGTQPGGRINILAPTCEMQRPTGFENNQDVLEWPLQLRPIPSDAGGDQFTITLT